MRRIGQAPPLPFRPHRHRQGARPVLPRPAADAGRTFDRRVAGRVPEGARRAVRRGRSSPAPAIPHIAMSEFAAHLFAAGVRRGAGGQRPLVLPAPVGIAVPAAPPPWSPSPARPDALDALRAALRVDPLRHRRLPPATPSAGGPAAGRLLGLRSGRTARPGGPASRPPWSTVTSRNAPPWTGIRARCVTSDAPSTGTPPMPPGRPWPRSRPGCHACAPSSTSPTTGVAGARAPVGHPSAMGPTCPSLSGDGLDWWRVRPRRGRSHGPGGGGRRGRRRRVPRAAGDPHRVAGHARDAAPLRRRRTRPGQVLLPRPDPARGGPPLRSRRPCAGVGRRGRHAAAGRARSSSSPAPPRRTSGAGGWRIGPDRRLVAWDWRGEARPLPVGGADGPGRDPDGRRNRSAVPVQGFLHHGGHRWWKPGRRRLARGRDRGRMGGQARPGEVVGHRGHPRRLHDSRALALARLDGSSVITAPAGTACRPRSRRWATPSVSPPHRPRCPANGPTPFRTRAAGAASSPMRSVPTPCTPPCHPCPGPRATRRITGPRGGRHSARRPVSPIRPSAASPPPRPGRHGLRWFRRCGASGGRHAFEVTRHRGRGRRGPQGLDVAPRPARPGDGHWIPRTRALGA